MDEQTAKRIKEISLDILVDFDKFCKEYNLQYRVAFGTLLGAVRHKGFIPWDDDIDVDMPIEEYIRFSKLWLKYGDKEKYFLQTKRTDPMLPSPFYRLRLNNTTCSDPGHETFPIHWGVPLDIFPVYNLPKSTKWRNRMIKWLEQAHDCCSYNWRNPNAGRSASWKKWYKTMFRLQGAYLVSRFSKSSSNVYYPYAYRHARSGHKELWYPATTVMFEGVELQAHSDPDKYLRWQYGDDYMTPPPVDQRKGHPEGITDLEHDGSYYTNCLRRNK